MMARRERERKRLNEKNQILRQDKLQLEGVEYFSSVFDTKTREIECKLAAMKPSEDACKLQEDLITISNDLQDLQKYFTSSTIFLSDHKIKICQNTINRLVTMSEEIKTRLVPKKKFGFKNKLTKVEPKSEKIDDIEKEVIEKREYLWTESNKSNQLIELNSELVNDRDLTFQDIHNSVLIIKGHPGSVQMSKMRNCLLLCGPIARSLFADNCENCTFVFACQQFRFHSSVSCEIYMLVTSRAIIEDCRKILVAPSNYSYADYDNDMKASGLDGSVNNWKLIGDFNWLSPDEQSPNWNIIDCDRRITDWNGHVEKFLSINAIQ